MSVRGKKIAAMADELVADGLLTSDQLAVAMESQKNLGGDLDDILIRRGYVQEDELNKRLAEKAGIISGSLTIFEPDRKLLNLLHPNQAKNWRIIPFLAAGGKLTVATADPFNLSVLDEARVELGRDLDCILVPRHEIDEFLQKYYSDDALLKEAEKLVVNDADKQKDAEDKGQKAGIFESRAQRQKKDKKFSEDDGSSAVAVVDDLFLQAFRERASDLHLEPTRDGLKVRLRVDGMLETVKTFPANMAQTILARIKIVGGMDVAEHRLPQDGRTRQKLDNRDMDIRIATYPTIHGEAAAIRLLTRESEITLEDMGFMGKDREIFEKLIERPNGIFLVTGPTGSGKTTTLYTALHRIDRQKHHVLTAEDPVENEIEGAAQTQVNVKAGLTFPAILRAMLREDPDIIMVGEIRDQETAEIAVRAAMTGHFVMSTLHTNSAIGAIARLADMGIETYLVASTLVGVMAQRLVRRICQNCKEPTELSPEAIKRFGYHAEGLIPYKGRGCVDCQMRGYRGRLGIFELLYVDDEVKVLISNNSPEVRLREKAAAMGLRSILEDGIEKIRQGITTVEEVIRVCGDV